MSTYKALHFCLPDYDNLGDQLAHVALAECFAKYDVAFDTDQVNIRNLRNESTRLDDRIDYFNDEYDLVVIGAGGLLLPFFMESIFADPESWRRFRIPLVFFGVGAIGEFARPNWYTNESPDEIDHLTAALNAAAFISVRDLRSWLLVSRLLRDDRSHLFMTGCPTVFCTAADDPKAERTHQLALNVPFLHGGCVEYQKQLLMAAEIVARNIDRIKWICHSGAEYEHARKMKELLQADFDIVRPENAAEIADAYSSCEIGLVTKAHAGIFCLANNTPFAFLSYDMKCDALMEMIVDYPHHFLLHIDRLAEARIPQDLEAVISRVRSNKARIKKSQRLLVDSMRAEFTSFANHVADTLDAAA
jgi:hypothetical protein